MARPPHKPTPTTRRRVAACAGAGMAHETIAAGLGIARGTLRKHYRHELEQGAAERKMRIAEALYRAGIAGNVAAAKAFLAGVGASTPPPSPTALGKKARAQLDAGDAHRGTEWEDLLPDLPPDGGPVH